MLCWVAITPHGDASVYDALVRMAQNFSMRYMLVDGQGNFGSVDGDPPAAYRYTEARMSKIALEMLTDIHKETVPFVPNYDDRLKEPAVLPSRFPNILVNGSVGIAVGMATNIPPHNLGEVIDGIHMLMENPDCTMDELMTCIQGPDFPTGGIIMGKSGIRAAYGTGRGRITLRGQTHFEKVRGRQSIVITEIPYMVNKARLVESIANLAKDKRIEGIHHIQDESSREGMRIVVELKKGCQRTDRAEQAVLLYPAPGYCQCQYAGTGKRRAKDTDSETGSPGVSAVPGGRYHQPQQIRPGKGKETGAHSPGLPACHRLY